MSSSQYQIGPCLLDCQKMTLSRDQISCKLSVKVFQLLKLFLTSDDHIVSRKKAIDVIWLGNEGVGKRGYTNAIWTLRKHFKELGFIDQDIFVTLPKIGYQLTLDVTKIETKQPKPNNTSFNLGVIFSITLFIGLVIGWFLYGNVNSNNDTVQDRSPSQAIQSAPREYNVTNFEGIEEHVAVSNSGQYVAFQWNRENMKGSLYIKDITNDSTPLNLITMGSEEEASPAWSYNDESIAYARLTDSGNCQIRVRHLVTNNDVFIDDGCAYHSFKRILAWSNGNDDALIYSKKHNDGVSLFRYDFKTRSISQVTFAKAGEVDFAPHWSEDNQDLLFIRQKLAQVYSLILQNQDLTQTIILDDKVEIIDIDWDFIANDVYSNYAENGKLRIIKKSLTTMSETLITEAGLPSNISLNIKNHELLVSDHISKEYVALIDFNNGHITRKISSSSRDMYGRFNNQSGDILFLSNRSGNWSVWLNNKLNSVNLTQHLGNATVPAISPDGKSFAVSISQKGETFRDLYIASIDKNKFTKIDTQGLSIDNVTWSLDNKSLYFYSTVSGHSGIFKITLKDNSIEQLTDSGEHYAIESESGKLYVTKINTNGIWELDPITKQTRLITTELANYDFASYFLLQGHLYFLKRTKSDDQVIRLTLSGHQDVVANFPENSIRKFFGIGKADNEHFIATLKITNEADLKAIILP